MKPGAVDREAIVPLWHQLYSTLRDQILAGTYGRGEVLPSERALTRLFDVSRITAQRAVEELATEGLVRREHGRGTFVTARAHPAPIGANMQALIDNVVAIGATTAGRIIAIAEEPPPEDVRAALGLAPGEPAHHSTHVRLRDDAPIGLITTWVPRDIGARISAREIEAKPMLLILEDKGLRPTWAKQAMGAKVADAAEAAHLGVEPGAPLVRLHRLVHDAHDRPIEYLVALYRGDRYEYRTVLRRDTAGTRAWSVSG